MGWWQRLWKWLDVSTPDPYRRVVQKGNIVGGSMAGGDITTAGTPGGILRHAARDSEEDIEVTGVRCRGNLSINGTEGGCRIDGVHYKLVRRAGASMPDLWIDGKLYRQYSTGGLVAKSPWLKPEDFTYSGYWIRVSTEGAVSVNGIGYILS